MKANSADKCWQLESNSLEIEQTFRGEIHLFIDCSANQLKIFVMETNNVISVV